MRPRTRLDRKEFPMRLRTTVALAGVWTEVLDPTVNGHVVKYFLREEGAERSAARHRDQFTNGAGR
jgi:hypothetical protein